MKEKTERPCHYSDLFIKYNGDVFPCCEVWCRNELKIGSLDDPGILSRILDYKLPLFMGWAAGNPPNAVVFEDTGFWQYVNKNAPFSYWNKILSRTRNDFLRTLENNAETILRNKLKIYLRPHIVDLLSLSPGDFPGTLEEHIIMHDIYIKYEDL